MQYYVENGFNPIYDNPFTIPFIDDISSVNTSIYSFKPNDASFYIQDKIELDEIIINAGIRYDYFNPNGQILSDPSDPFIYDPIKPEHIYDCSQFDGYCGDNESIQSLEDRLEYWYLSTSSKSMISPRLGASFPISDAGVFHFSAVLSREEFELLACQLAIKSALSISHSNAISAIVNLLSQDDPQLIDELECVIEQKRRQLKEKDSDEK